MKLPIAKRGDSIIVKGQNGDVKYWEMTVVEVQGIEGIDGQNEWRYYVSYLGGQNSSYIEADIVMNLTTGYNSTAEEFTPIPGREPPEPSEVRPEPVEEPVNLSMKRNRDHYLRRTRKVYGYNAETAKNNNTGL